jgi:hypothetical protein
MSWQGGPASGLAGSCAVGGSTARPRCPPRDVRVVYYGLLGPRATAVTYRDDDGQPRRVRTAGADGAYLVVVRPNAQHPPQGYITVGVSPGSGLLSVHYRGGRTCRIVDPRRLGGARTCPLIGYRPPGGAVVTAAQVAAPVHARVSARVTTLRPPATVKPPARSWSTRRLTVTFRARVAAYGAGAAYVAAIQLRDWKRCQAGYMATAATDRDIAAGEVVTLRAEIPARCRGPVRGWVTYHRQGRKPGPGLMVGDPWHDPRVGSFNARVPR